MKLSSEEYATLLRQDFSAFVHRCFLHLNPATEYHHNWHVEVIGDRLEAVRRGEVRRQIINVPPRSLKSLCASVAFSAWILGHQPSAQILCASYAQDLADRLAMDCRSIMTSSWYQAIFPTRLLGSRPSVSDFMTTQQGGRFATSVGGVVTGRGADFIIVDDALKPGEAFSKTQRESVNHWYDHTLVSRLNDKRTGRIIVIMQRLHTDDLVGHLMEHGGWDVLTLPAIAEQEEVFTITTPWGRKRFTRQPGDLLHPAREPLSVLQEIRHTLGEYNFAGQYQQSPVPLGGNLVKKDWFQYYQPHELPDTFDQVLQSWDTASK